MNHVRRIALGCTVLIAAASCASPPPIVLQAESATLHATTRSTTRPGYEGAGYVSGFANTTGEVVFTFNAVEAGIYDLQLRYSAPPGGKGYTLTVNDIGYDGFFAPSPDAFANCDAGKVELNKGANRIVIGKGWGFYDLDSVRLTRSTPYAPPKPVPSTLVTRDASPEARALMAKLSAAYGKRTFSGVTKPEDADYVRTASGMTPAIMGGDLIEYTPSRREHGSDPAHETERVIDAAKSGQIATLCWHWNAPTGLIDQKQYVNPKGETVDASWYFGFYSKATTFDFADALDHPDSPNYQLLLRDIDVTAGELRKLADAKVPVLWRPLHESDGTWFWWGAHGPDHFKKLWRLVYDRLVNHHKLNNLIWVYTWNDPAWYPGDDVVDIVGIDAYPSQINDPQTGKWADALRHFDGRKMIALSEFGGVPDVPRMQRLGVHWSYFASWSGPLGPKKNTRDELIRIYRSPAVANREGVTPHAK